MAEARGTIWGTGRRKTAVARVRLVPGTGRITRQRQAVRGVLRHDATSASRCSSRSWPASCTAKYDVHALVHGGGPQGQAEAVRHGVARALKKSDEALLPKLRESGYLTRDSRRKERKKYGQRGARARFQFSKR